MITGKDNLPNKRISDEVEEQNKIYLQLSQLDMKLKYKPLLRQAQTISNPWDSNQIAIENELNNLSNNKFQILRKTNIPHIEYFSQITNQEFEEDSLFVNHNNFLGQLGNAYSDPSSLINPIDRNYDEINNEVNQEECSFGIKNSRNKFDIQKFSQIVRQRNDVYKKLSQRTSSSVKCNVIQNDNKQSNEKKSLLLQKSRQKLKEQINNQFKLNKQNLKRKQSNQKYSCKANFIQEQMKIQQSDLNKFSAFEPFLSQTIEADNQQISCKNSNNFKEQNSFQCTFKPTIPKKSSDIVKSTKNVVQTFSAFNPSKEKKPYPPQSSRPPLNKQRIEQLSQPRRLKTQGSQQIQQIPSFRPSLSKKSIQQMANCVYDVATRNQLWLQQKKQKLKSIKQQQELQKSKRQSYTYTPVICPYKQNNDPSISKYGKQGITNHFQRLLGFKKNLTKPKGQENVQNKQNKSFIQNQPKLNQLSKSKKPSYQQAVKQLHDRIMSLKI